MNLEGFFTNVFGFRQIPLTEYKPAVPVIRYSALSVDFEKTVLAENLQASRTQTLLKAISKVLPGARQYYLAQTVILTIAALMLFVLLSILKSMSVIRFNENHFLYAYSIVLFIFQMSRLMAALIYTSHARHTAEGKRAYGSDFEPSISFVIPCKNEEGAIFDNIDRCFSVKYPKRKVEVIVVNDGSTDNTMEELNRAKLKFPQLQIIDWANNRGKRHAMAAAIKIASGEIIIQLDSDSYIEPGHLRGFVQPFKDSEISAVCAHADPSNKSKNLLTKAQAGYYFMAFRILKAAESNFSFVLCCSGCCSAYRKSTIMPLIDEFANEKFLGTSVSFGDDRSLTNLILKQGKKTIYVSNVQAYTIVPENLRTLIKQQVRWKKSWLINTSKAGRYIWKLDPFMAATYFYPLAIITLVTPFMAIYGLIYYPLSHQHLPLWFLAGTLIVTCLFMVMSALLSRDNRHWYYLVLWSVLNTFLLSLMLPYALLTIRNNKWGTR